MTPLRLYMHDAMLVRGFAVRTPQSYLQAIAKLARCYPVSPDPLTPDQVEARALHWVADRKLSNTTVNLAASACRFLYRTVMKQHRVAFGVPMAKAPQRRPKGAA